jgi:hypothetical protein
LFCIESHLKELNNIVEETPNIERYFFWKPTDFCTAAVRLKANKTAWGFEKVDGSYTTCKLFQKPMLPV